MGFDADLTLLSFLICIVETIFLTLLKKRINNSFRFTRSLEIIWKLNFPKIIKISPVLSMVFNHEKLKANEVEGINNMTKNINDPISPIEEDNE